jgi:hypothetical protein
VHVALLEGREVVILAADLPDAAMPGLVLDFDYHTGDAGLDATVRGVRQLRRQADELSALAAALMAAVMSRSRSAVRCW